MNEKDLGYDQEQLLVLEGAFHKDGQFIEPFMQAIGQMPQIKASAKSLWVQGLQGVWRDEYKVPNSSAILKTKRSLAK